MAGRSFTLPPGFRYSSLAKISAVPAGASLFICSIGVSPTSFDISSLTRRREFEVVNGTLQSKEQEGEASMQGILVRSCHPERSERSAFCGELQIARFPRNDDFPTAPPRPARLRRNSRFSCG